MQQLFHVAINAPQQQAAAAAAAAAANSHHHHLNLNQTQHQQQHQQSQQQHQQQQQPTTIVDLTEMEQHYAAAASNFDSVGGGVSGIGSLGARINSLDYDRMNLLEH